MMRPRQESGARLCCADVSHDHETSDGFGVWAAAKVDQVLKVGRFQE